MKIYIIPILAFLFWNILGCSSGRDLQTVDSVDLERYQGKWYEIARLANSFEEGCRCVTAQYGVEEKYVSVLNRCYDEAKGEWKDINGKAFAVKGSQNSKLKVQFFWPFKGDYFIIDLDDNYQYAMVGSPNRKFLWILSRDKILDEGIYVRLIEKAKALEFDTDQIIMVNQGCEK